MKFYNLYIWTYILNIFFFCSVCEIPVTTLDTENGFHYLSPIEGKRPRSHSLGAMTQSHNRSSFLTTSDSNIASEKLHKPFNNNYYSMFSSCCELNSIKHKKNTKISNSRSFLFANEPIQFKSSFVTTHRYRESTINPTRMDTIGNVYREKRQSHPQPRIRCSFINNYFEILKKNREYFSQYDFRLKSSSNMPNIVELGLENNNSMEQDRVCQEVSSRQINGNFSATLATTDSLPKFRINDENGRRVPMSIDSESLDAYDDEFDSSTFDGYFDENILSDKEYIGDAFDMGEIPQTKCCESLKLCKKCVFHLQKLENKFSVSYDE